jgi:hypothetical protein
MEGADNEVEDEVAGGGGGGGGIGGLKSKGRKVSDIWSDFTDVANPQKLQKCACKHCGVEISLHRKSEVAVKHLKKCQSFKTFLTNKTNAVVPTYMQQPVQNTLSQSTLRGTGFILPPLKSSDLAAFQEDISMHYIAT